MRRSHSLSSPMASASFEESLQVATSPCCGRDLPGVSLGILPGVPGPLPRQSRGVHLPVSSSTSSVFPRTRSRSASRVSPSKRFPDGSLFRDCSHFVMFRPSGLLASPIVPTAAAYRRRAAEAFYVRAEHASLPPHASDMLTTRPGNSHALPGLLQIDSYQFRGTPWTLLPSWHKIRIVLADANLPRKRSDL